MKIGIDGRLINQTGVGRYIRNLVRELGKLDKINIYVLYLRRDEFATFTLPNKRWQKRLIDIPWHSLKEQILVPFEYLNDKLDLVHIPYFNVPIFYPGRMVVTIHDLIIDHFDTGKATTGPYLLYKLRRLAYQLILYFGLARAAKVLTVSEATKRELMEHYGLSNEKIVVTYEGADKRFTVHSSRLLQGYGGQARFTVERHLVEGRYFLYVGNAYPHKNLEFLLRGFGILKAQINKLNNCKLVLVGGKDYFYKKLEKGIADELKNQVIFWGEANDKELKNLYTNAIALVFPSLMEGFGLPALEAVACGCPILVSDIPVFHEVLGELPIYFRPEDEKSLISAMQRVINDNNKEREKVKMMQKEILTRYNWTDLATKTLKIYENSHSL